MPWLNDATVKFYNTLSAVAPMFKDSAFEEEKEWRVVSPLLLLGQRRGEEFRAGRYAVVPYMNFDLPRVDGIVTLREIVVGPTESPAISRNSLRWLCDKFEVDVDDIRLSGVPFRHWDAK